MLKIFRKINFCVKKFSEAEATMKIKLTKIFQHMAESSIIRAGCRVLARYMEAIEMVCCIRGYHLHKEIWEAVVGEVLMCEREPHNSLD